MTKEIATRNNTGMATFDDVFNVDELAGDLTQGAGTGGFQTISIRGSKWRVKSAGEESPILNDEDEPIPSVEVVLVKANKGVSKLYYKGKYSEGDDEPPTCMSVDGVVPDPSSVEKQSKECATCKWNQWGSRITESGKKAKVCSDSRRVAVQLLTPPPAGIDETEPMLLRIPAASLADLASYGNKMAQKNFAYNKLVTRLGFDVDASFPKLTFRPVRPLNEDELAEVVRIYNTDTLTNILSMHPEAPANPVVEETSGGADDKPQDVVSDEFEMEEETPPPAKETKPAKKKATKKAPKKEAKKPDPEAEPAASNMDDELDSIIGDLESLS